jgi:hypothetical protein
MCVAQSWGPAGGLYFAWEPSCCTYIIHTGKEKPAPLICAASRHEAICRAVRQLGHLQYGVQYIVAKGGQELQSASPKIAPRPRPRSTPEVECEVAGTNGELSKGVLWRPRQALKGDIHRALRSAEHTIQPHLATLLLWPRPWLADQLKTFINNLDEAHEYIAGTK